MQKTWKVVWDDGTPIVVDIDVQDEAEYIATLLNQVYGGGTFGVKEVTDAE
jgi:hypothetical protein